jgi:hypothetical protein
MLLDSRNLNKILQDPSKLLIFLDKEKIFRVMCPGTESKILILDPGLDYKILRYYDH